jgi:glycosyltransferase involved in cell wall biosynthesis
VSVIVPTFNRVTYLRQALESALAQTYSTLEILVADDASSEDLEGLVLSRFSDPRIKYRRNPVNLGMGRNTWQALASASGKYVATLHDDDIWEPDFLASLVPALEDDPSVSVAFSDHTIIDADGVVDERAAQAHSETWGRSRLSKGVIRPFFEAAIVRQSVPAAMAALFRKSAIDWNDFPAQVGTYYDVWLAYLAARTGAGAYYEPRRLTRYRVHGQSETGAWAGGPGQLRALRQAEFVERRYLADPALASLRQGLRKRYGKTVLALALALLEAGEPNEAEKMMTNARGIASRHQLLAAAMLTHLPAAARREIVATARRLRSLVASVR